MGVRRTRAHVVQRRRRGGGAIVRGSARTRRMGVRRPRAHGLQRRGSSRMGPRRLHRAGHGGAIGAELQLPVAEVVLMSELKAITVRIHALERRLEV